MKKQILLISDEDGIMNFWKISIFVFRKWIKGLFKNVFAQSPGYWNFGIWKKMHQML